MSQLILDGRSSYDVSSIEADRYFDMPGYVDRADIEAKCVDMAEITTAKWSVQPV